MKTVIRRLRRLEDQVACVDRPRRRIRLVVCDLGDTLSLEGATCQRALCSDGTLLEMVCFNRHNAGPDPLTDEELDRWVESFPVH